MKIKWQGDFYSKVYEGDAGYDLSIGEDIVLPPFKTTIIDTNIKFEMPLNKNIYGDIRSRSSIFKRGLIVNGTIDRGYRDFIKIMVYNGNNEPIELKKGQRVAQVVFTMIADLDIELVESVNANTSRGKGGFGSTGRF